MRRMHVAFLLIIATFMAACSPMRHVRRIDRLPPEIHRALLEGDSISVYDYFRTKAEHMPNGAQFHSAAAVAARQAQLLSEALEHRRAALALSPDSEWDRIWAARLLLAQGDPEGALRQLGRADGLWADLTRAQALRCLGRNSDALFFLESAALSDPTQSLVMQERAELLEHMGRLSESASAYSAALSIDPSQTHLQVRLAKIERKIGLESSAYERLRRFLLVDASHPAAKAEKAELAADRPDLQIKEQEGEEERVLAWTSTPAPVVTPLPPTPLSPLRVGIVGGISEFRVKFARPTVIRMQDDRRLAVPEQTEIRGKAERGGISLSWARMEAHAAGPTRIHALEPESTFLVFDIHFAKGFYWSDRETRSYRGDLYLVPGGDDLLIINLVDLEEYLPGVIPSEMPYHWPIEALKAQAVAARTETLRKLGRHEKSGYDICSTQHCAVYRGAGGERKRASDAVLSTRGQVLKKQGRLIDTVYAGNCGGWGSSPSSIWSGDPGSGGVCDLVPEMRREWHSLPYDPDLRERFIFSRIPAYCGHKAGSPSFRWTRCYSAGEIGGWLERKFGIERLEEIRIGSRTHEGWITGIVLTGESSTQEVRKDAIRSALNMIRSNYFTIEYIPAFGDVPARYFIYGAGWGHGAGMCQDGVFGLADRGRSYREIISHYYPNARMINLY